MQEFNIYTEILPKTLEDFDTFLNTCTEDDLQLNICSPGGDIFVGVAIAEKLLTSGKKTRARVWGYAASAAFTIACACDFVQASPLTKFMVHSAYDVLSGEVDVGAEKANDAQIDILRRKNENYSLKDLKEDVWMSAQQAKKWGLVDEIVDIKSDGDVLKYAANYIKKTTKGGTKMAEEIKEKDTLEQEKQAKKCAEDMEKTDEKDILDVIEKLTEEVSKLRAEVDDLKDEKSCKRGRAKAEDEDDDEKKDTNARVKAIADAVFSIGKPAQRPTSDDARTSASADLKRHNSIFGNAFDSIIYR